MKEKITFPIVEIFSSIEGEGIRAGYPCTFIRLLGCNLRCSYCDTTYSYTATSSTTYLTSEEIVDTCKNLKNNRITVTGGEPLFTPKCNELVYDLLAAGFYVNIETNGSLPVFNEPEFDLFRQLRSLMYTVDYKCPSSGMCDKMDINNFARLSSCDVVKFVVGSDEDLDSMKNIVDTYSSSLIGQGVSLFVSPVFGNIEPCHIVDYLLTNDLQSVRIQLQLHKFIWDPNKRGV